MQTTIDYEKCVFYKDTMCSIFNESKIVTYKKCIPTDICKDGVGIQTFINKIKTNKKIYEESSISKKIQEIINVCQVDEDIEKLFILKEDKLKFIERYSDLCEKYKKSDYFEKLRKVISKTIKKIN